MRFLSLNFSKGVLTSVILVALACYFTFHAIEGDHGLRSRVKIKQKLELLEQKHADLLIERKQIEHYINLMHADKLDPDMLDEQARKILNMAHPKDVVIMRELKSR